MTEEVKDIVAGPQGTWYMLYCVGKVYRYGSFNEQPGEHKRVTCRPHNIRAGHKADHVISDWGNEGARLADTRDMAVGKWESDRPQRFSGLPPFSKESGGTNERQKCKNGRAHVGKGLRETMIIETGVDKAIVSDVVCHDGWEEAASTATPNSLQWVVSAKVKFLGEEEN
jgi:hypothetical protein